MTWNQIFTWSFIHRWVGLPQPHPAASLLVFSCLGKPSPAHPYLEANFSVHLELTPCFLAKKMLAAISCLKPTSLHWKPSTLSPPNLSHHNPQFAFAKACRRGDESGRTISVIFWMTVKKMFCHRDCQWAAIVKNWTFYHRDCHWAAWSSCSVTCGIGVQTRHR